MTTGVQTLSLSSINGGQFQVMAVSLSPAWHTKNVTRVTPRSAMQGWCRDSHSPMSSTARAKGHCLGLMLAHPFWETLHPSVSEAPPGAACVFAILNLYQGSKELPLVWIYARGQRMLNKLLVITLLSLLLQWERIMLQFILRCFKTVLKIIKKKKRNVTIKFLLFQNWSIPKGKVFL